MRSYMKYNWYWWGLVTLKDALRWLIVETNEKDILRSLVRFLLSGVGLCQDRNLPIELFAYATFIFGMSCGHENEEGVRTRLRDCIVRKRWVVKCNHVALRACSKIRYLFKFGLWNLWWKTQRRMTNVSQVVLSRRMMVLTLPVFFSSWKRPQILNILLLQRWRTLE